MTTEQPHQSPEFVRLYETYTAGPSSIGAKLAELTAAKTAGDPLIVATSTDIILFPKAGHAPDIQGFRLGTRGFKELAAVSHHGPAVASLLRMRELDVHGTLWRSEAERLIDSTRAARLASSETLWRDRIDVAAYRGREARIAELVDYACSLTERYLHRVLREPDLFTRQDLRDGFLEARNDAAGATVPMNAVMIATFFLVAMDIGHRVIGWFDRHTIDWSRAMVLIVGKQGRPTAGVTWTSNSVCSMILGASGHRLPLDRLYIAPHAPTLAPGQVQDVAAVKSFEAPWRQLWVQTRAVSELGPLMYDGYPRFDPTTAVTRPLLNADTVSVSELPAIAGPDDWFALNTRLRVLLEDPRQLLSGCVTDYAVEQLQANGNDPSKVQVPGLDGTTYPPMPVGN